MNEKACMGEGEKFALGTAEEQAPWQDEYHRIVAAARARAPGLDAADPSRSIGLRLPRHDVLYKVRGRARYAANITLDGMLHGAFARSPHACARIISVDTARAAQAPGVHAVLVAGDIPDDRLLVGPLTDDMPILAKDRVRYMGEPLVAIAAESLAAATAACGLVEIEYEALTPILTPEEALAPGAPRIDPEGNTTLDLTNTYGDIEAGLAVAEVVVEDEFEVEPAEHCFLESQSGVAFMDSYGVLTLLASTQYPHFHHKQLARVTGLPLTRVRVIQTVVGGAFGGKIDNTIECAAGLLALKSNRPVKMTLSREEVFTATTKTHAMRIRQKLGADHDGRLVALDLDILSDGGAYRSYSMTVAGRCLIHAGMPYRIANLRARFRTIFTNHVPSGAMRSFGVFKQAMALESQIDEIAHRLGIGAIEIRRLNGFREGDATSTGQRLDDVGLQATLDAIEPIYEERRRALATRGADGPRKRGLGIACLGYGIGYSGRRNPSSATLTVSSEGGVTAYCGTPDIGTGSDMALAQIAAESLGVSLARIRVVSGDSTKTEDSGPTSASRTTYFSGNAVCLAAAEFKASFAAALARVLDCPADQVRIESDEVVARNERMTFEAACGLLGDEAAVVSGYGKFDPDIELDILGFKGNSYATYTYATHLAEVEIDEELGTAGLVELWAAHDGGRIVNPIGAEGQVEGGAAMGLGLALWEKVVREGGQILNPHYRDYLLAGALDMPAKIHSIFVENRDRTGPYGAKGMAEASMIPVPAAVAGGIRDAAGIRPTHLPMGSEQLLGLIEKHRGRT
jgi:CO/xanthine dehydrogenase Mo-binding subunit